jgi:hypothetical protein
MKDEPIKTVEYHGYQIKIYSDDTPYSPREDDNLGTMVCFHRNYSLGDKHSYSSPQDFLFSLVENVLGDTDKTEKFFDGKPDSEDIFEIINKKYIILALYLYDHSGISISTQSFVGRAQHAEWDSGQVGWIYLSHERIKEEMARPLPMKKGQINPKLAPIKIITNKVRDRAYRNLECETQTYDDYLRGDVVGRVIELNGKDIDSCWGFYPDHPEVYGGFESEHKYMLDECKSIIDHDILKCRRARQVKLKAMIRTHVPIEIRQKELTNFINL